MIGRGTVGQALVVCLLLAPGAAAAQHEVGAPLLSVETVQSQGERSVSLLSARLRGAPAGARVTVTCGGGCFRPVRLRVAGRTRDLPLPALRNLTLRPGTHIDVRIRLGTHARRELRYLARRVGPVVKFVKARQRCGTPRAFPSACPAGIEYPLGLRTKEVGGVPSLSIRVAEGGVWLADYSGNQLLRFDRARLQVTARTSLPSPRVLGVERSSVIVEAEGRLVRVDRLGRTSRIADPADCVMGPTVFRIRPILVARWNRNSVFASCPEGIVRIDTATGARTPEGGTSCSFFPGGVTDGSSVLLLDLFTVGARVLPWCYGPAGGLVPGVIDPDVDSVAAEGRDQVLLRRIATGGWVSIDASGAQDRPALSGMMKGAQRGGLILGDLVAVQTRNGTVRIGRWDGTVVQDVNVGRASDFDVDRGELWYFNQDTQGLGKADLRAVLGARSREP